MVNSDYSNTVKTIQIVINNAMSLTSCIDGPIAKDLCGTQVQYGNCTTVQNRNADPKIKIVSNNGCVGYTYNWQYRQNNSTATWYNLGTSQEIIFNYSGSYQIRCTVTDACGVQKVLDNIYITHYCSTGSTSSIVVEESEGPEEEIILIEELPIDEVSTEEIITSEGSEEEIHLPEEFFIR
ncbi:MAG: hypothetical protein M3512_16690 [Bacteroidota bacterium]|nr:hypothetical protein [Bacteroidota bacterium]MDQ3536739.1 hypothetical protein [Bacteroidota bacterium]